MALCSEYRMPQKRMTTHDDIRTRWWSKLRYHDPELTLRRLRELQYTVARSDLVEKVRNLRRRDLKKYAELRQAALFCYGMSRRMGQTIFFAPHEQADHDAICFWAGPDGLENYAPLQLKELPPPTKDPRAALNTLLASLEKYRSSPELQVAIYLNKTTRLELQKIVIPRVALAGIWLFGAESVDQRNWNLIGDLRAVPERSVFIHPEPDVDRPGAFNSHHQLTAPRFAVERPVR